MFFDSRKSTVVSIGVACVLMFSGSIYGQNIVTKSQPVALTVLDSTKEQDGLSGSVRRVRTESAKLELQGERLIEGSRQLLEVTTYDPRGNRIENVSYPLTSSLVGKEEYKYDEKGNIIEMTLRDENGTILSKEAYDYEFDRFGNWTKMATNLLVFEDGKLRREPIEVTYRTLTYYFDDQIAKIVEPSSPEKKEVPATSQLSASSGLAAASGLTVGSSSSALSAPLVSGFDPPPDVPQPAETEKNGTTSPVSKNLSESSNSGVHSIPEISKPVEIEKSPAPAPGNDQPTVSSANPRPDIINQKELRKTPAPVLGDTASPNGETSQIISLKSSPVTTTVKLSDGARAENVAGPNAPPREAAGSTQGFEYFKVGRSRFDEGDLSGALTAYLKQIELRPDSAEVYLSLGQVYLKLEKNKDAAKAFKNSVRLNPAVAEAQYGLGLAYFRIGHHKDAADAFKQATVLRPDLAKAHYGLALAYQELGKSDALTAEFRILQTLDAGLAKRLSQAFPEFNFPCGASSSCR